MIVFLSCVVVIQYAKKFHISPLLEITLVEHKCNPGLCVSETVRSHDIEMNFRRDHLSGNDGCKWRRCATGKNNRELQWTSEMVQVRAGERRQSIDIWHITVTIAFLSFVRYTVLLTGGGTR